MKKTTLIFIIVIVALIIGGITLKFLLPSLQNNKLQQGSKAGDVKATINVAGDNYLGYWFITSSQFDYLLHNQKLAINWVNDGGNYAERNQKFKDGKYDIMVLPVSTYIEHGAQYNYPGVIVGAISDSKGADNILAYTDKIKPNGGNITVNDLNNASLKFAVTPDSPSSFLLNTAIVHFDLNQLKNTKSWMVETSNGSSEAFEKLKQKKVDVAVLWEPDVSKALSMQGLTQVFGSDQINGMIIDVFVVNRQFLIDHQDYVLDFFNSYYDAMSYYATQKDSMVKEMARTTNLSQDLVKSALNRIYYFDKVENSGDWFAQNTQIIGNRGKIIDTINQVIDVMIDVGDIKTDPLNGNPYNIIASDESLSKIYHGSASSIAIGATLPTNVAFSPLTIEQWNNLQTVGTLKVTPILFQSGTSQITNEGQKTVDEVAVTLTQNYQQYRVIIKGHTAPSSNESANVELSQNRADSVKNYLQMTYGIDTNRVLSIGVGSKEPLQRLQGEGDSSYKSRLSRVEFILLK